MKCPEGKRKIECLADEIQRRGTKVDTSATKREAQLDKENYDDTKRLLIADTDSTKGEGHRYLEKRNPELMKSFMARRDTLDAVREIAKRRRERQSQ